MVELVTFATSAEKSAAFWLTDSRSTLTPAAFRSFWTMSARPVERTSVVDDHHARRPSSRRAAASCTRHPSGPGRRRRDVAKNSPCSRRSSGVNSSPSRTRTRGRPSRTGETAVTSSLPAGPITPHDARVEANDCATVEAIAGFSCVSPWTMLIFGLRSRSRVFAKYSAQCSWSSPIEATGPVNGPMMPIWIGFEHETVAGAFATAAEALLATPGRRRQPRRTRLRSQSVVLFLASSLLRTFGEVRHRAEPTAARP